MRSENNVAKPGDQCPFVVTQVYGWSQMRHNRYKTRGANYNDQQKPSALRSNQRQGWLFPRSGNGGIDNESQQNFCAIIAPT